MTTPICRRSQAAVDLGEVDAVDEDAAALRHIEPLDQLCKGAFAGTGGADDADHLAGGNVESDILEHFRSVDAVAERDVLEPDVADQRGKRGLRRVVGRLDRRVENIAQPRDRQARLMKVLPQPGEPQHRRADPARQHVEGDEFADA